MRAISGEVDILFPTSSPESQGLGRSSHPFLACPPGLHRSAGRSRRLGKYGGGRGDSVEALCGLAGVGQLAWQAALGSRSATSGEHHDSGDAGNLAGQFRSRCNRTHGPGQES